MAALQRKLRQGNEIQEEMQKEIVAMKEKMENQENKFKEIIEENETTIDE